MSRGSLVRALVMAGLLGVSTVSALSTVYTPTKTVDAGELLEQLEAWREAHPEGGQAAVAVAKVHCFMYAYNRTRFAVTPSYQEGAPPDIVERHPIPVRSAESRLPVSEARLNHLAEALLIGRGGGLNLYGYACREAAARCEEPGWSAERFEIPEEFGSARVYWESEALAAFRKMRTVRQPVPDEIRMRMNYVPEPELESLFLYRMLSAKDERSAAEDAELAAVTDKATEAMALIHGPVEGLYTPERESSFNAEGENRLISLYPPLPAEQNGAEYLLHAADALLGFNFPRDVSIPFTESQAESLGSVESISEDTLRVMEEFLSANRETLRLMREAAQFDTSRYPGSSLGVAGYIFSGTTNARWLTQLAAVQVVSACQKGEGASVVDNLATLISCANSLQRLPDMSAMLVRIGAISKIVDVLQWGMLEVDLTEQQLMDLQRAVASMEDLDGLRVASAGTKVPSSIPISREDAMNHVLRFKITDVYDPGNANIAVSEDEIKTATEELQAEMMEVLQSFSATASLQNKYAKLSLDELYERVRVYGEDNETFGRPIVDHVHDSVGRTALAHLRGIAEVRVAQAALAVARFRLRTGEYPRDLDFLAPPYLTRDAIVDPFTGESLRVQRTGSAFTVYSVGYPKLNQRASMRSQSSVPSGIFFTIGASQGK